MEGPSEPSAPPRSSPYPRQGLAVPLPGPRRIPSLFPRSTFGLASGDPKTPVTASLNRSPLDRPLLIREVSNEAGKAALIPTTTTNASATPDCDCRIRQGALISPASTATATVSLPR